MSDFNFAASDYPDDFEGGGFKELVPGEYLAQIIDTDISATKRGDGEKLTLKFEVVEGEFSSTYIWHNLNIANPNPKAVEISSRQLAQICRAVGIDGFQTPDALIGKRCMIAVGMGKANRDYPARPEIKAWMLEAQQAAQPAPAQPAAQAAHTKPWLQ